MEKLSERDGRREDVLEEGIPPWRAERPDELREFWVAVRSSKHSLLFVRTNYRGCSDSLGDARSRPREQALGEREEGWARVERVRPDRLGCWEGLGVGAQKCQQRACRWPVLPRP